MQSTQWLYGYVVLFAAHGNYFKLRDDKIFSILEVILLMLTANINYRQI